MSVYVHQTSHGFTLSHLSPPSLSSSSQLETSDSSSPSDSSDEVDSSDVEVELLCGIDPKKDQSYFLCHAPQSSLRHTLFPLGDLEKQQTREIAQVNVNIPVY